jgi:hypothetical protein
MAKCRIVAIHARRGRIAETVRELVKRLGVRTLVASGALEGRVDAGLPEVPLEDPPVGHCFGRLYGPQATGRRRQEMRIAWRVQPFGPLIV